MHPVGQWVERLVHMHASPSELQLLQPLGKTGAKARSVAEIKAAASSLWPVLEAVDALKEARSVQEAGSRRPCSARGTSPAPQLLPSACPSEPLFSVLFSLRSCRYAGDAVAFQPGCADDHRLLPLHVHGVGAAPQ